MTPSEIHARWLLSGCRVLSALDFDTGLTVIQVHSSRGVKIVPEAKAPSFDAALEITRPYLVSHLAKEAARG